MAYTVQNYEGEADSATSQSFPPSKTRLKMDPASALFSYCTKKN